MALTKAKGHILADDLALGGNPTTSTQSASDNSTKIATTAYVTTAVANLVDGAPSTLNTLNEIAAALNDDAALNTTLTNSIATKLPLAGGTMSGAINMGSQNITALGTKIESAGALTIDCVGQLNLDSGNDEIHLRGSGTTFGKFFTSSNDFYINQPVANEDIVFTGSDGTSTITAMFIDMSAGGRVGFGPAGLTNSPTADGITIAGATSEIDMTNTSTNGSRFRLLSKNDGHFQIFNKTDSVLGLHINDDGKIGIGTNSPTEKLTVDGIIQIKRTGDHPAIRFMEDGNTRAYMGSGDWAITGGADDDFGISSSSTGDLLFGTDAGVEKMRISNAGNVGINCTAPEEKLTVDGGVKIANSNKRLYFGTEGGTSHRALEGQVDGSTLQVGEGYGVVLLGSASAKVGIRQSSPDAMLHIDGGQNSIAAIIAEGHGNGDVIHQQFKAKANNGTLSYHGITAKPGADQANNELHIGNVAGKGSGGIIVNHDNKPTIYYPVTHWGSNGEVDVGGTYMGANGASVGTNAIFRTPIMSNPSSGTTTSQFLTLYSSGHWGEYPVMKLKVYSTYFNAGYREYMVRAAGSGKVIQEMEMANNSTSFGAYAPTVTMGAAVDTGTDHSGQNIYRFDLTLNGSNPYNRDYVVVEILYGANRYYSSAVSTSTLDGYTNGGKYHFKTISNAEGRGQFVA